MKKILFLCLLFTLSCTKVYNQENPGSALPTSPTTTADLIEFRVFGTNLTGVPILIRHTDPINGMTAVQSGVPYLADIQSTDKSVFLYIEASGASAVFNATLQVQIFVNGRLFRESSSQGFVLYATASGTYRR